VISIIGVAAGVMALVIALAINNGFRSSLEGSLLGATAHVSILEKETAVGIDNWQQIAQKLSKIPHVVSASPGLYDSGYISGPVTGSGAVIKGVSVPSATVPDTLRHLKAGSLDGLVSHGGEQPGIILGSRLADNIGAVVGKTVQLLVPNGELTPFGPRPTFVRLRVAGTFESGFYDLDMNWAFMALPQVQKAFGLDDVVNSIELRLDDIYKADEVAAAAEVIIGPKLTASTWQEQNHQLLNALKMERVVTVVTIGLIQVVAALNILIALVMMVMEKHRDIAILLSMGAKVRQIRKIFIFEGALIGAVGTSLGLIVGYLACFLADHYRWLKLDEQVYSLAYVPFSPRWIDGIWIAAAALAVSLVATLYPARSATRIAPVEALRYE
jgi:lipoprotein-releasing system permease protein